jgi:hypothetical protein
MRPRHRPREPQPDGVETSLRRSYLSRKDKVEKILEAIPYDRWVSAAEIAAETRISDRRIAALIRENLLGADVEQRPTGRLGRSFYLYKRLRRLVL